MQVSHNYANGYVDFLLFLIECVDWFYRDEKIRENDSNNLINNKHILQFDLMIYLHENTQKVKYQQFTQKEYFPHRHPRFATLAIHAGQQPEPIHGSINTPIHMSSTYAQRDIAEPYSKFDYTRGGNPTRQALEECLAAVEYGKKAITFSSGCGGLATILHTLKKGDHMIVCDDVYGGTQKYIENYVEKYQGIEVTFVDMTYSHQKVTKEIKSQTKMIWIETPSNPNIKIIDIQSLCKQIKKARQDVNIVVDNTFASPYVTSPLLLGADVCFHSLTKYIGGHSDLVMGALIFKDEQFHKEVYFAAYSLGANPSPFDCYLALRGIKTLEGRILQATSNAFHIAHFLERHPAVQGINYPGLKSNKYHELAKKQMRGFGGMLSFKVKGNKQNVRIFLQKLQVIKPATSLGGVHSNVILPSFSSHANLSEQKKAALDITDNLVRFTVGVEWIDDLIEDLDQALRKSQQQ